MAGKSVRDFKRRIRSVNNTKQITKAMKMVSAAKLRKAQERAEASRPYTGKIQEILARLVAMSPGIRHPLLENRPVQKVAYIVVTADRGLCGGFNTNIIRKANQVMAEDDRKVENSIVAVGRKARDFYRKRGTFMQGDFINLGDKLGYAEAREIAQFAMQIYEEGAADEINIVFSHFVNAMRQVPACEKLLPIEPPTEVGAEAVELAKFTMQDYIYEPSADEILISLLPRYVGSQIYHALLESKASEHGARMTAMGNATKNASELVDKLTLEMNNVRQAAITTEILEIVGGAEALRKGGK
ncbi:MAG: ATP synthase F1 subunit gamma [Acidobacteriota bacterium]